MYNIEGEEKMRRNPVLYKSLVVGVIVLFIGVGIQPVFAINNPIKQIPIGKTLYVGGSGEGNYTSIQDAVDNADNGDTVFVFNGIYYENVWIDEKTINLIGEDTETTIIDDGGDLTPYNWTLLADHADGSTIQNLTLQNVTTIYGRNYAFIATHSDNMKIINCRIRDSIEGMYLMYAKNTTMRNNRIENNTYNFGICGKASDCYNDIDTSNTINGKPIYNLVDESDVVLDGIDIGWLGLINCTNITVKNIEITDNLRQNILIIDTKYSTISNCTLYNSTVSSIFIEYDSVYNKIENCPILDGVLLSTFFDDTPDYNTITNCNLTFAIFFQQANHNTVENCNINLGFPKPGVLNIIGFLGSNYNTISNCTIYNNSGVPWFYDGVGCSIGIANNWGTSNYNNIINNKFINFSDRAVELLYNANRNNIIGNRFLNSGVGILIASLDNNNNNNIYHNNFINNSINAYDECNECNNHWDNGYPFGGNYWDDYTGEDLNGDGIGDTPYSIPGGNNEDRYPLMVPWSGNQPPNTPTIDGPIKGNPGIDYDYTFVATDPDGDEIWYHICWGDKEIIYIYGPYPSGEELTLSYNWSDKGTYTITCWARDIFDSMSNASSLEVTIPRTRASSYLWYEWLLERFPLLERLLTLLLL
jgi:parallel beta-helix repeat protein